MAYKNQKLATGACSETRIPTHDGMQRVNDLVPGDILLNKKRRTVQNPEDLPSHERSTNRIEVMPHGI